MPGNQREWFVISNWKYNFPAACHVQDARYIRRIELENTLLLYIFILQLEATVKSNIATIIKFITSGLQLVDLRKLKDRNEENIQNS